MDTTKSMEYEIFAFKTHITAIVNVIRRSAFTNYILIPFGDEGKSVTKTTFFCNNYSVPFISDIHI